MRSLLSLGIAAMLSMVGAAQAAVNLTDACVDTIAWLERHQNADGSWGDGATAPMVTAEALLALAKAERASVPAAQRAITWLRNQRFTSVDYRARAIRALEAAGSDMTGDALALRALAPASVVGWGPASRTGVDAYDSALALGAILAADVSLGTQAAAVTLVADRALQFAADAGGQTVPFAVWHGEQVQLQSGEILPAIADGTLNVAVTAEIVRGMEELATDPTWLGARGAACNSVSALLFPAGPASDTLEVALRLAAFHTCGQGAAPLLQGEILADARFGAPVQAPGGRAVRTFASSDPLVHAIALLALRTSPSWVAPPAGDIDGDGVGDAADAFPYDPWLTADLDRDGIADPDDGDRDGDGVANGADLYPDDPREWANADGDVGTEPWQGPDNADADDDNDGLSDLEELARGSDPRDPDSDDDGWADLADACPTAPIGGPSDADGDGVCDLADACPQDPFDVADLDVDGVCDGADPDDDGDQWLDGEEIAFGSDPRDAGSDPGDALAADPAGDADGDGLSNATELAAAPAGTQTSPLRPDTDDDGAADGYEVGLGTNPRSAASQPAAVIAVFGAMSTADEPHAQAGGVRHTLTGGQATPPARAEALAPALVEATAIHLSGFQPQTTLGRDLDGDGLAGAAENAQRTSNTRVDTDGDRFVDGAGSRVRWADHPELSLYNLDGAPDPFADGEADFGTDPSDAGDHPGKPGDVAPLFHPDGRITAGDGALLLRIVADPAVADDGGSQNEEITRQAADADGDGGLHADDALRVLREAGSAP